MPYPGDARQGAKILRLRFNKMPFFGGLARVSNGVSKKTHSAFSLCHFISRKNATKRALSSTNTQSQRVKSASGECLDSISLLHYYNYFVWHKLKSMGRQKLGSPSKSYTCSNSCRTTPRHQVKPGQKNPAHNLEGVTRHGGDEEIAGEGGILLDPGRSLGNRRQQKTPIKVLQYSPPSA